MNTNRRSAAIIGALYIIGTVAGVLSVVFAMPLLSPPDDLARIAGAGNQLVVAALLVLTMGLALALVPVVLYPIARMYNEPLALGYVVFRGALETIAYVGTVASWLALVAVARDSAQMDAAATRPMGMVLLATRDAFGNILIIVFSTGALMLYSLLYQSRLVPRWLSVWGLVAILMHLATVFVVLLTGADPMSPTLLVLNVPIFLQEMVMAIWLIAKGFSPSAFAAEATTPEYARRALAGRAGR
jgi:hypothetical protein